MSDKRWSRAQALCLEAEALPEDARAEFLELACDGNAALRAEVDALLQSDEETRGVANRGPATASLHDDGGPSLPAGTRLGTWGIERLIGRGGMGEVYEAKRADGAFELRVAVKLLKRGLDTDAVLARFTRERRIHAQLSHSNIAHVLDAGVAPDGRPFLAMEYVQGGRINEYVRSKQLSTGEILRLMITVCEAVQAAHAKRIVHRDLKPSNVLVTDEGQVKLLDFGIAKAIGEEDTDAVRRMGETMAYTPAYAAPEQILGLPASPASDVYALGVILYELLAERRPYRPHPVSSNAPGVDRENIEPPSASLRQERGRLTESQRLQRLREVTGDLDLIVLKAMQAYASRRYATAQELADDLQRWLEHQPILARPDSLVYRTGRFVRRNRVAVVSAALVISALAIGLAAALWQAHVAVQARNEATQRRQQADDLIGFMLGDLKDRLYEAGRLDVLDATVSRAYRYLAGADPQTADPVTLAERSRVLTEIAEIDEWRQQLPQAIRAAEAAVAAARQLQTVQPGDRSDERLARALVTLVDASKDSAPHDATLASAREAYDLAGRVLAASPQDPDRVVLKAVAARQLAIVTLGGESPDPAAAEKTAGECIALLDPLLTADNARANWRMFHLQCEQTRGYALSLAGDSDGAARQAKRLAAEASTVWRRFPEHSTLLHVVQDSLSYATTLFLRNGRLDEAAAASSQALEIGGRLLAQDPDNIAWLQAQAVASLTDVRVRMARDNSKEAQQASRYALQLYGRLIEHDPDNSEVRRQAAYVHLFRAQMLARQDDAKALDEIAAGLALISDAPIASRSMLEANLDLRLYQGLYAGNKQPALKDVATKSAEQLLAQLTGNVQKPQELVSQRAMLAYLEQQMETGDRIYGEMRDSKAAYSDLRRLSEFRAYACRQSQGKSGAACRPLPAPPA